MPRHYPSTTLFLAIYLILRFASSETTVFKIVPLAIIEAGLQVNINGEESIKGNKALVPENPTARATFGEGNGFDQLLSKTWNEVVRAAIIHRIQNDVSKYSLLYAQDLIVWWGLQQSSEQISKAEVLEG